MAEHKPTQWEDSMAMRLRHSGNHHLSPRAGREPAPDPIGGRRALARRVRGPLHESERLDRPPHPDPLPASGERERPRHVIAIAAGLVLVAAPAYAADTDPCDS